jgi:hypothetical protein
VQLFCALLFPLCPLLVGLLRWVEHGAALHLSSAEAAEATHFLTCDDRVIRRYSGQMTVESPVTFTTSLT